MMTETNRILFLTVFLALAVITPCIAPGVEAEPTVAVALDSVILGDASSERMHQVTSEQCEVIRGGLGEPARRLLPGGPVSFEGGTVSFTLKVDPEQQNYLTVKLWGSDKGAGLGRLVLFADGLQVGYRHEGDYDVLNQADDEAECPGRFLYQTLPLPPALTQGKSLIHLKIISLGEMWPYGPTFAQYQKNLTEPTRGIYRVYSHTQTRLVPDASEKQGQFPEAAIRPGPGEETIAQSKQIVIARLDHLLQNPVPFKSTGALKDRDVRLLLVAEAYNTAWTPAYHDPRAIAQIVQDGDSMAGDFASDPNYAQKEWVGAGPLGQAVMLTWPAIAQRLDETALVAGQRVSRRQSWASALRQSVDYWRTHRRSYTNQSMIVDWNIYTANRALQLIDAKDTLPETRTLQFLYQAVGIDPWLGSDPRADKTPVADTPDKGTVRPYGDNYYLVTRKGLSRELGWVGTYGETILHFMCDMVKFTGDEKIRQQLAKLEGARMCFRYPGLDADGYHCMKLVSEIDNRTAHYPLSGSAYTAPGIREEWWTDVPALLGDDPVAVGAAQQCLADNQYFAYVKSRLNDPDTLGMMRNVDDYEKVKALPPSASRLPMTDGQPDFAFADEEDAIVAVKHGDTRLFVNLYYRAERAVNGVARVYETTPTITRIATVRTHTQIVASGHTYTRPDWIDAIRSRGMPPPAEPIHEAWAGEEMPVAARPDGAEMPEYGDWGPFLGKAAFYQLQYGDYLIVMNCSQDTVYPLVIPPEFANCSDLITGKPAAKFVQPRSTVILHLDSDSSR
jgi:hypothetical protein